jgi:RNA polymerase sigma-70 factor (ECF subfamily)
MNTENGESETLLPTRESLLSRLRDLDDQTSWEDFFETYWKLIYSVARKAGLNDAEAQDVVQETIVKAARKLPGFKYDPAIGSFKAWLLTITRSRIQDQFRKKAYRKDGRYFPREEALNTPLVETMAAPDSINLDELWEEEWRQNTMNRAVERVKLLVSPKQYQMFYLHGLKAMPAREVAERLQTTPAEVYTAKYRVADLIKKEIEALEGCAGTIRLP